MRKIKNKLWKTYRLMKHSLGIHNVSRTIYHAYILCERNVRVSFFDSAFTFSKVGVDTHITRRSSKTLVFPIRYVFIRIQIYVLFGQSKIDYMNNLFPLSRTSSYQEILWLDITINQVSTVDVLYPMELKINKLFQLLF